jgi:hypothetical protein
VLGCRGWLTVVWLAATPWYGRGPDPGVLLGGVRRFVVEILAGLLACRHPIVELAMIKRLCAVVLTTAGLLIDARLVVLVLLFLVHLVFAHHHLRLSGDLPPALRQANHGLYYDAGYPRPGR